MICLKVIVTCKQMIITTICKLGPQIIIGFNSDSSDWAHYDTASTIQSKRPRMNMSPTYTYQTEF